MRDTTCGKCPLNDGRNPCVIPPLEPARVVVLSERPLGKLDRNRVARWLPGARITALAKCGGEGKTTAKALKACRDEYLARELSAVKPVIVLALGAAVAKALGCQGKLDLYAGQDHKWGGFTIIPTYSLAQVKRDATLKPVFGAHLKRARRVALGLTTEATPEVVRVTDARLWGKAFKDIRRASHCAFDIETNGLRPYVEGARIETIAFTLMGDGWGPTTYAVPLAHPQSPYASGWVNALSELRQLCKVPHRIAHNGKFDCKWLRQFGLPMTITYDTMLAGSLLDENRRLSLKHMAQAELGVDPWAIDAMACADQELDDVLEYNGLDTAYTLQLYLRQRKELVKSQGLTRILTQIMVPASNALTCAEGRALPVSVPTIESRLHLAEEELAGVDRSLASHVPGDEEPRWNSSKWLGEFLYDTLGLPVLERTPKGAPSTGKAAMGALTKEFPDHPVIRLLNHRRKLEKKIGGFYRGYLAQIADGGELHTTFRLGQTVTGRTSSGKEVDDSGSATDSAGINLQQVPRDPDIRGLFRAPEGWHWIEADYSQLELRVAASLSEEPTMLRLYREGADLHTHTAQQISGQQDISKEWRTRAKAVNFGFLYGMGAKAFQILARDSYGVDLTLREAQEYRESFFAAYPYLRVWHEKQKSHASKYGFVETPFGRRRRLPVLLQSGAPDDEVARALRQSVNSPVQGHGSDMCLWALSRVHKYLTAHGMQSHIIGTVHDSIDVLAPHEEVAQTAALVRRCMEDLPMSKVFGVTLPCPIRADIQVGPAWGEGVELPPEVSRHPVKIAAFLRS